MSSYAEFVSKLRNSLSVELSTEETTGELQRQEVLSGSSLLPCLSDSCAVTALTGTAAPQSRAETQDGR